MNGLQKHSTRSLINELIKRGAVTKAVAGAYNQWSLRKKYTEGLEDRGEYRNGEPTTILIVEQGVTK